MKKSASAAVAAALFVMPAAALAQQGPSTTPPTPAPAPTAPQAAAPTQPAPVFVPAPAAAPNAAAELPANTSIIFTVNNELSSRNLRVGDTFGLTVAQDVSIGGNVVIPRGTRASGEVVWRTGRGAFGKSAKMEVALRYIDLDGRRIPLTGSYRRDGDGNTGATAGAVVAAGVIGGILVHGRSATIPAGFEITGRTIDTLPVEVTAPAAPGVPGRAVISTSYTPSAIQTGRPAQEEGSESRRRERNRS